MSLGWVGERGEGRCEMSSLTREMSVGLDRQSTVPPDDPRVRMDNPTPPGPVGEQLSAEQGAVTVPKTFRVRELHLSIGASTRGRVAQGRCLFVLVQMNRNSTFKRFMSGMPGWREGRSGERVELGHWDVYKTHTNNAQYDSWPRSCTNCLDNIWTYYQRVCTYPFHHRCGCAWIHTSTCICMHVWAS